MKRKGRFPFRDIERMRLMASSVKLTEDGKKALLKLSKGDMRRALNVLQACHAAYDLIGEDEIYNCTGNPHPTDIESVVNSMLSDDFTTSYKSTTMPPVHFSPTLTPSGSDICPQGRKGPCIAGPH